MRFKAASSLRIIAAPVFALALCLSLASCGEGYDRMFHPEKAEKEEAARPRCPQTGLVATSDDYPAARDGALAQHLTPADIVAKGHIVNFGGGCAYNDKTAQMDFSLEIDFSAQKGPAANNGTKKGINIVEFPYFIAVLGPDETILQRQEFSTKVDFDNKDAAFSKEAHEIHIPVSDKTTTGKYKIALGYRLTPAQAAFNKQQFEKKSGNP
ncbi:MAG: hypothetical protein PW788_03160 [Micavibrio sp.]|nr:hypothetical protein [Micavibrio sp.]